MNKQFIYNKHFFSLIEEGSRASARAIVPMVTNLINPKSVVDVGCGQGVWLSVFKEEGISDLVGIDGDYVDKDKLEIPRENFITTNFNENFPEKTRNFDLVVSLEVAEHVNEKKADEFVSYLISLGGAVLFSAAIPFQGGVNHVNEQWQDYWISKFHEKGFVVVDCIRPKIWENKSVELWYKQNIFLFIKKASLKNYPLLEEFLDRLIPLRLVHPDLWCSREDLSKASLKQKIAQCKILFLRYCRKKIGIK